MKNTREYFRRLLQGREAEVRSRPAGRARRQGAYRPHERCTSAGDIVWLVASEWGDACEIIDKGKVDFVLRPAPAKVADSVAAFEKNADEIEKRLAKLDDAAWEKNAQFLMDGKVAWEAPLGDMLYGFLFDAIHHRGQLSSYLRPDGREGAVDLRAVGGRPGRLELRLRVDEDAVIDTTDRSMGAVLVRCFLFFGAGYLAAFALAFVAFGAWRQGGRAPGQGLLEAAALAAYALFVTAAPAAFGFGIATSPWIWWRELPTPRVAWLSTAAGVVTYVAQLTGLAVILFWIPLPSGLGAVGSALRLLVPGLAAGLVTLAVGWPLRLSPPPETRTP